MKQSNVLFELKKVFLWFRIQLSNSLLERDKIALIELKKTEKRYQRKYRTGLEINLTELQSELQRKIANIYHVYKDQEDPMYTGSKRNRGTGSSQEKTHKSNEDFASSKESGDFYGEEVKEENNEER